MWRQVPSTSSYANDDRILVIRNNNSTPRRPSRNQTTDAYRSNNGSSDGSSSSINDARLTATPLGYAADSGSDRFSAEVPDASSSSGDANRCGYRPLRDYGAGNSVTVDTVIDSNNGTTALLGRYGSRRPCDNRTSRKRRHADEGRVAGVTYCAWLVALLLILLLMALFYAMVLRPIFEQRRLQLQNRNAAEGARRPVDGVRRHYGNGEVFGGIYEFTSPASNTVASVTTTIVPKVTERGGGVLDATGLSSSTVGTATDSIAGTDDAHDPSRSAENLLHAFGIFSFSDEVKYSGREFASIVVAGARGEEFIRPASSSTEAPPPSSTTTTTTTTTTTRWSENQMGTMGLAASVEAETSVLRSTDTAAEPPQSASTTMKAEASTTTAARLTTRTKQRYSHHPHRGRKPLVSTPRAESTDALLSTTKYYIVETRPTTTTAATTTTTTTTATTKPFPATSLSASFSLPAEKAVLTVFNPVEALPSGTYGEKYGTLDTDEYDETEDDRSAGGRGGGVSDGNRRLPNHAFDDSGDEGIQPVEISMESEGSDEFGGAVDDWTTFEWPPSVSVEAGLFGKGGDGGGALHSKFGGKTVMPVWRRLPPGSTGDDDPPPVPPWLPFAVSASVMTVAKAEPAPPRSVMEATTLGPAISTLKRRRAAAPTVVTALLDIGRGEWPHFTRPFDIYLAYFEKLLRLENNMIVYGEPRVIQFVDAQLGALGAAARRRVQTVEIALADLPLYRYRDEMQQILDAEQADWADGWDRQMRSHPEARYADYDVLVNSKPYLLQNATRISKFQAQFFVWVDAGYGHGSDDVIPAGVVWCPRLTPDRITLFRLTAEVERIERYRLEHVYRRKKSVVSGGFLAGDAPTLQRFNAFFTKTFMEMLDDAKVDDDQTTLLMTIRHYRSLFHILDGGWFNAFKALPGQCA